MLAHVQWLVAAGAAAVCSQGGGLTNLEAVYGRADAWTLALSADSERLFLSEGAVICVYPAGDLPPRDGSRIAEIPIQASVLRMHAAEGRLLVAGGSAGLHQVDLTSEPWSAEPVDDAGRKVCTDVVEVGEHVVALFAARDASELRGYSRAKLEPTFTVGGLPGMAFDLAVHGSHVYLALGPAGMGRVDLDTSQPSFEPGPGPASFPAPPDFLKGAPYVRAVEIIGDRLFAAADVCGLATVDLTGDWGSQTPVSLQPLSVGGKVTYAGRIAVSGERIVVGGHKGPVVIQDGAPITTYGALGFTGRIADTDLTGFTLGTDQTLVWFRDSDEGPVLEGTRELGGGWGDFLLRGTRVWGNYVGKGKGFQLDELAGDGGVKHEYNPLGFAGVDGVMSGVREGVFLFGTDSACSSNAGLLEWDASGDIRPTPGSRDLRLGFVVGPRWPGPRPETEWVLGGHGFHWELFLLDWAGDELAVASWALAPPLSPDVPRGEKRRDLRNYRGREFFLGYKRGDLLLLSTHGTRYGLLGYSAKKLTTLAERTAVGKPLDIAPAFQIETHPGGEPGMCFAWRMDDFEARDGRRILALAAGMEADAGSPAFTRPMLQLYRLGEGLEPPKLLGRVLADNVNGNLMGVEVGERGGRHYAFTADGGFGMHVFDVTVPEEPSLVESWATPPNAVDGHYDNVIDIELWDSPDGRLHAYLAAVRLGVAVLDVSDPTEGVGVVELIDTPGLAYGVHVAEIRGRPWLIVGDHQAGVRIYGLGGDADRDE